MLPLKTVETAGEIAHEGRALLIHFTNENKTFVLNENQEKGEQLQLTSRLISSFRLGGPGSL
jgi:hypothetical protein